MRFTMLVFVMHVSYEGKIELLDILQQKDLIYKYLLVVIIEQ